MIGEDMGWGLLGGGSGVEGRSSSELLAEK